jgi:hypothetical protein
VLVYDDVSEYVCDGELVSDIDDVILGKIVCDTVLDKEGIRPIEIVGLEVEVSDIDFVGVRVARGVFELVIIVVTLEVTRIVGVIEDTFGATEFPYHQRIPEDALVEDA